MADSNQYVEKSKPVADPQVTGLIYGNKNKTDKPQESNYTFLKHLCCSVS